MGIEAARSIVRKFKFDDRTPILQSNSLSSGKLTVSRLKTPTNRGTGLAEGLKPEDLYVVSTQLVPLYGNELWRSGKLEAKGPFLPGEIGIVNLKDAPAAFLPKGYDCVQFYIPAVLFDELAKENDIPHISELEFHASVQDDVIPNLAYAILPYISKPIRQESMFLQHIALAINLHLAKKYGSAHGLTTLKSGLLSSDQLRRALELLTENFGEEHYSLAQIANECGLPTARFVEFFRKATSLSPASWLRQKRVEHAKAMIMTTDLSLADVAYASGFADQSHMTKAFVKHLGLTPGGLKQT